MLKIRSVYQILLLLSIVLAVYLPTLSAPFNTLDDVALVNLLVNQDGFSFARHFSAQGTHSYFRPLITLSFEIDKAVGGLQEPFMHLFNVAVHALNVVLLWLLSRQFLKVTENNNLYIPFFAALLFGLHPINTESVNWIMARTDLLAGTFVFISVYCLLHLYKTGEVRWGLMSAASFFLGTLCKETTLFLVPSIYLVWLFLGVGRVRSYWITLGAYAAAVIGYFAMRWGAYTTDQGLAGTTQLAAQLAGSGPSGQVAFPWEDAIRVILKATGFYAAKLFQPLPLNFAIIHVDDAYIACGVLLIVLVALILWKREPVGWLFVMSISLGVSALLVLFTKAAWTPIAERYMYIPSAPFALGIVHLGSQGIKKNIQKNFFLIALSLLLIFFCYTTYSRNLIWQDNLLLYQDAVRQSPDFFAAREHLAIALREHGRPDEAFELMKERQLGDGAFALLAKSKLAFEDNDYEKAEASLIQLLKSPGAYEYQALEMLIQIANKRAVASGEDERRREHFLDMLRWLEQLQKSWPSGFVSYRIGRVHLLLGNKEGARQAFSAAAAGLSPDSPYYAPALKLSRSPAE